MCVKCVGWRASPEQGLLYIAQGDELAPRMRDALLKGKLGITALSPRVTTGKEQWQEWHHDFFHNQMEAYVQVFLSASI